MKRKIMSMLAVLVLLLAIVATPVLAEVVPVEFPGTYTNLLTLENKDALWVVVPGDGIGATLGYNPAGSTFDYGLVATGLSNGDYALIYYADTEDRFVDWGGDNPGAVIGTGTSSGGVLVMSGTPDLGMDLPCPPDANAYLYNYTTSDGYVHATGAKIWLVPMSVLTGGSLPVSMWPQTNDWLFETDLITFDDTDVVSDMVGISINPSTIAFPPVQPGATSTAADITIKNLSNTLTAYVSASTSPAGTPLDTVLLDGIAVNSYTTTIAASGSDVVTPTLPNASSPFSGTLTFTASATP